MTQIDILLSNNTQERESRRLAQSNEQAHSAERYLQAQSRAQQDYEQSATSNKQASAEPSSKPANTASSTVSQLESKRGEAKQSSTAGSVANSDIALKNDEPTEQATASDLDGKPLEQGQDDFYAQLLAQLDAPTDVTSASTPSEAVADVQSVDTDAWPVELKQAIAALTPQQFEQFKAQFSELAKQQGMSESQVKALADALTQLHQGGAASSQTSNANTALGITALDKSEQVVVNPSPKDQNNAQLHSQAGQQSAESAKGEQVRAQVPVQVTQSTNKGEAQTNVGALVTQGDVKQLSAGQSINAAAVLKSEQVTSALGTSPLGTSQQGNAQAQQVSGQSAGVVQANSEAMSAAAKNTDIKAGIELNLGKEVEQNALDMSKATAADSKELKPAQLSAALMSHLQSQGNGSLSQAMQNDNSQWQQVIQQTNASPVATERAAANLAATANAAVMLPVDISKADAAIQLQQRVNMMLNLANQQAEIRIDPPELGSMQVRVRNEGEQAHVHFLVQNQQAKEALEQSMPRLRELLAQQGLELGESQVDDQGQHGFGEHSEQGEPGEQGLAAQQGSVEQEQVSDVAVVKNAEQKQGIDFYA